MTTPAAEQSRIWRSIRDAAVQGALADAQAPYTDYPSVTAERWAAVFGPRKMVAADIGWPE